MPMRRGRAARARAVRPARAAAAPQMPRAAYTQAGYAQPYAARYAWPSAMGAPLLPTLLDAARTARAHRLRAGLTVWRAQVDRLHSSLDAWDRQLAAATGDTAPTTPYDTTSTGAPVPSPVDATTAAPAAAAPVTATPVAGTTAAGRTQPSARVLYPIFDDLPDHAHMTESGYPPMAWINEELEEIGIGRADTTWVHQKYDAWLHARSIDQAEEEEEEHESGRRQKTLKKPTTSVLESVFTELRLDDPKVRAKKGVMTKSGTPSYDLIEDELEEKGYAPAHADQIADAFADWQKETQSKQLKKPTDAALSKVFARLDLDDDDVVTAHGVPRKDVVKKELEEDGYSEASADQIKEAFEDWKEQQGT